MDKLDLIRIFVRVVESGSFTAVAHELSIGQPAVSKRIAALEMQLGGELIRRSSRTFSLTEIGREFYNSSIRILEEFEAATTRVANGQLVPKGLVRVQASPIFGRHYVTEHIEGFLTLYPEVSVELLISNGPVNLIEEGVDVAIHSGELSDSSLVTRMIARSSIVTVATPTYLQKNGSPSHPIDLNEHQAVIVMMQGVPHGWNFRDRAGKDIVIHPKGRFRTNDAEQMRVAVLQHLGIANAPAWLFAKEIASGAVRRLLPDYERPKVINALRPSGRRQPAKVKVFIDFLERVFSEEFRAVDLPQQPKALISVR